MRINRSTEQNRDSKTNPYSCSQLNFNKDAKAIQGGKKVFLTNGVERIGYPYGKKETSHSIQKLI